MRQFGQAGGDAERRAHVVRELGLPWTRGVTRHSGCVSKLVNNSTQENIDELKTVRRLGVGRDDRSHSKPREATVYLVSDRALQIEGVRRRVGVGDHRGDLARLDGPAEQ